jgi:predicted PurR-regulated permease PerM
MIIGFGIIGIILGIVLVAVVLAGVFGSRKNKNNKEEDSSKLL